MFQASLYPTWSNNKSNSDYVNLTVLQTIWMYITFKQYYKYVCENILVCNHLELFLIDSVKIVAGDL